LVRPVHVLGERREHYESLKDVWEMFRVIVEQRKRREVDPTVQVLSHSLEELDGQSSSDSYTRERLRDMADFFDTINAAYGEVSQISPRALRTALKVRGKIRKLLKVAS
jgi:DNA-binding transcriptional regulator GbsR (MarR family)